MKRILEKLRGKESLNPEETGLLFDALIGDATSETKAALLTALSEKGESVTEIAGMAEQMRRHAVTLPPEMRQALDTCGTGGDGARSLNLSTLSALVLSSMGVPIVKHGNRSVTSSCGSADLLEGLGFPLDLSPAAAATLFKETRFAFLFAPLYHPAMKSVGPIRKALRIRTIFNFLGPLSNPARVLFQVLGVPSADRVYPFADVLKRLGLRSAMVVHGDNPSMDELSPCGITRMVYFLEGGPLKETSCRPEDFGIAPALPERLRISGSQESVARSRDILSGKGTGDEQAAVAINVAGGLFVHGRVKQMTDGMAEARAYLKSGQAISHVEKIIQTATRLK